MVEVLLDESQDTILHVVDRDVPETDVAARIDATRRFDQMQQHSGQHILSQAIVNLLNLDTVSSRLSLESPSTIDLQTEYKSEADILAAEDLANVLVWQDRLIKTYLISQDMVPGVPFRKAPQVAGAIRVVEVEGFDYSACGGTHCTRTGMVGLIKILRTEKRSDKLRIYFTCGRLALRTYQEFYGVMTGASRQLSVPPEELGQAIARQNEQLEAARDRIEALEEEMQGLETRALLTSAESFDSYRLVIASFRDRTIQQLRGMAAQMQNEPMVIALLGSLGDGKLSLAVACAPDSGINATELALRHLVEIGARGGGDARLAQGGGPATESQFQALFARSREHIRALHK